MAHWLEHWSIYKSASVQSQSGSVSAGLDMSNVRLFMTFVRVIKNMIKTKAYKLLICLIHLITGALCKIVPLFIKLLNRLTVETTNGYLLVLVLVPNTCSVMYNTYA